MRHSYSTQQAAALVEQMQLGVVVAPFAYDGLQARILQHLGMKAIYMTGFGISASRGLPDLGLTSYAEVLDAARVITESVDLPVICDADTGYGGSLNVMRTVRGFESAGVAALHLEDQSWPKRCGYLSGKKIVPVAEMLDRLKAALDARCGEMLVIARTDALQSGGWTETEDRARRYREAGADLVFVDGIGAEDLQEYARRLGNIPTVFNNVPLVEISAISSGPFDLVLHPGPLYCLLEAFIGSAKALSDKRGAAPTNLRATFETVLDALGAAEFGVFEERVSGTGESNAS